jgi:hypothetical protein
MAAAGQATHIESVTLCSGTKGAADCTAIGAERYGHVKDKKKIVVVDVACPEVLVLARNTLCARIHTNIQHQLLIQVGEL